MRKSLIPSCAKVINNHPCCSLEHHTIPGLHVGILDATLQKSRPPMHAGKIRRQNPHRAYPSKLFILVGQDGIERFHLLLAMAILADMKNEFCGRLLLTA